MYLYLSLSLYIYIYSMWSLEVLNTILTYLLNSRLWNPEYERGRTRRGAHVAPNLTPPGKRLDLPELILCQIAETLDKHVFFSYKIHFQTREMPGWLYQGALVN